MYVITGATGNTGNVAARILLSEGKAVRAIGRNEERLAPLSAAGAEAYVADITDSAALTKAFSGARAVYAMIPPNMASKDFRADQDQITEALTRAIEDAGVKYVVSLSSIGADKTEGTGPIVGLHRLEQRLNRIPEINVLHLRAGYFMENTLAQIGTIQSLGLTAGPLHPDLPVAMIATRDIGLAAARALLELDFKQQQTLELQGERDISMTQAAQIIGKAIGRRDLRYEQLPDEQLRNALVSMGLSANVADLLLEMASAMNRGDVRSLESRSASNTTPTSYETFVREEFVPRYSGKSATA